MPKLLWTAMLGLALWAVPAAAEPQGEATPPKCLKAEVNPVTGHVLCIDPLGAPVEAPPPSASAPCKENPRAEGDWTYSPNCRATPSGS